MQTDDVVVLVAGAGFVCGVLFLVLIIFVLKHCHMIMDVKSDADQYRHLLTKAELKAALQKQEHEHSLLEARVSEQEFVLDHISGELHDNYNGALGAIKLTMEKLRKTIAEEENKVLLDQAISLMYRVSDDFYFLSRSLNHSSVCSEGLIKSVQEYLQRIEKINGIDCELKITGDYCIPATNKILVFRIIQEALHNIVKHAQAKHIWVKIVLADYLRVEVRDDGKGITANKLESPGLGIKSMHRRAKMLNGTLEIEARPGEGSLVKLAFFVGDEALEWNPGLA